MARYERIKGGEKNELSGKPFVRGELEKVYQLYIEIEGKGIHENNPKIHVLAEKLGRTVRSVENQLLGFKIVDTGKVGRANYNKIIGDIWKEKNLQNVDNEKKSSTRLFDDFKFRISSQIKNILGRNLITDDFVAVFELVKNSFDAHSKNVRIYFEKDKIIIADDGKGMNRQDIINKWLFLAYSAKSEGVEDAEFEEEKNESYRDRINPNRSYAGEKGIGRLGCDRLGSKLKMTTRKINDPIYWTLSFDWGKYEVEATDEFGDIEVAHSSSKTTNFNDFQHGLILEITNLRDVWPRKKILDLKKSLGKLINPFAFQSEFSIEFFSKKELEKDGQVKKREEFLPYEIVNGKVENFIFASLNIATTLILSTISDDEEYINTILTDRGKLIYQIREPNPYKYLPRGSTVQLFYLNFRAKINFKAAMGITSNDFGSIFLFNNGFRVLPYGEPTNDPFNINLRKSQGYARFLGTRELIGHVSISENSEQFKETSSRDGGLVESVGTNELSVFFIETLKKLESFVAPILWKISKRVGDNEENLDLAAKSQVLDFVEKISGKKNIELVNYSDELIDYITENVEEKNLPLFDKLRGIAEKAGDVDGLHTIAAQEKKYQDEVRKRKQAELKAVEEELKRIEAEKRARDAEEAKKEIETENSFLKSIATQDLEVVLSFMHSIGISANMIDNYLSSTYQKLRRGMQIDEVQFKKALEAVALESRKIISISRYATKANFKVYADKIEFDVVNFLSEYLVNVIKPLRGEEINIEISNPEKIKLIKSFKPIELNLIVDNFISNSIRANSKNFYLSFEELDSFLNISFRDDGLGISKENLSKVAEFGYTTTSGSGLGLFHVKQTLDDLGWEFEINNQLKTGVEFIVKIKI